MKNTFTKQKIMVLIENIKSVLTYDEVLTNTKIMLHNKRGGLKTFLLLSPECVRLSCLVGYIFNKTEQQIMNVSALV